MRAWKLASFENPACPSCKEKTSWQLMPPLIIPFTGCWDGVVAMAAGGFVSSTMHAADADLHHASLEFWLLRTGPYDVGQDVGALICAHCPPALGMISKSCYCSYCYGCGTYAPSAFTNHEPSTLNSEPRTLEAHDAPESLPRVNRLPAPLRLGSEGSALTSKSFLSYAGLGAQALMFMF